MAYQKKDPAQVRAARQAAAAKSAEARRANAAKRGQKPKQDISIKVYREDAEALAELANKANKSRTQFVHEVVEYIREQKGE